MDPCIAIDLKRSLSCMTLKLSLPHLVLVTTKSTAEQPSRCLLSLLNRARSKPCFLSHFQHMLVN